MKKVKPNLVTIKVQEETQNNFKLAAALANKKQYEVSLEGSEFVLGKYQSKKKSVTPKMKK